MKEIQTPRSHHPRFSDPAGANRRPKDSQSKNRKISKKSLNAAFSVESLECASDLLDSASTPEISESVSECDQEFLVQGSRPDLLFSPDKIISTDLSAISTITSVERNVNISNSDLLRLISEIQPAVRSLHVELNDLKLLVDRLIILEETDRSKKIASMKVRLVCVCFFLWILVVAGFIFFGSGEQASRVGLVPT